MDDMTELEVCRLSAEALGYDAGCWVEPGDGCYLNGDPTREWNPLTNAEQRWECRLSMLKQGYTLTQTSTWFGVLNESRCVVDIFAPPEEHEGRAVAELQRRKT